MTGSRGRASRPAAGRAGSGTRGSTPTRRRPASASASSCGRRSTRPRPARCGTPPNACCAARRSGPSSGSGRGAASGRPARHKWEETSLVKTLESPRLAGLREWQGKTYPAQWPAILDEDTHERLVKLFADPSRRAHVVGRKRHLLSGIARCGKCGGPLYPVRGEHGEISDLPVRHRACRQRVRRDLGQRGDPRRVRDRRGAGRAGIPPRAAGGARRRGHQRAAPRGTAGRDPQGAGQAGRSAAGLGRRHHRQGRLARHQAAHRSAHRQSAQGIRQADRLGHGVR